MTDQTDVDLVENQTDQVVEETVDLDSELIADELPDVEVSEEDALNDEDDESELEPDVDENGLVNNPIRQLRTVNRDLAKKLKLEQQEKLRLQKQLESTQQVTIEELPPEPDLSDDDVEYDPDKFKAKYAAWVEKKARIESQKKKVQETAQQAQAKFQERLQKYEQGKSVYKGIDEAEKAVLQTLDVHQQGIIVNYADDPAFVVWALGKNPVALNQLATIQDPIEYAVKVRDIEKKAKEKMTVKKPPAPEKVVTGRTAVPSNYQKQLDKLREAGDVTGAIKLKKQLREKGIDIR